MGLSEAFGAFGVLGTVRLKECQLRAHRKCTGNVGHLAVVVGKRNGSICSPEFPHPPVQQRLLALPLTLGFSERAWEVQDLQLQGLGLRGSGLVHPIIVSGSGLGFRVQDTHTCVNPQLGVLLEG